MPMQWTEPELYLEHPNGVKVWRTYKENRDTPMSGVFTTCECDDDAEGGSEYVFDVYDLPEPRGDDLTVAIKVTVGKGDRPYSKDDGAISARIVNAINKGELQLPEENQPTVSAEPYEYCSACTTAAKLEKEGVTSEDLEQAVNLAAQAAASKANGKGLHAQVEYLLGAGVTPDNIHSFLKG